MERCFCWICNTAAYPSLKGVLRHMAGSHAFDPRFSVCCGIQGCSRTYSNFYSFKKHVYRKHRENLDLCPLRYSRTEVESPVSPVAYSLENDDDMVTATTSVTQQLHHNHQIAKFLLKLKEVRKVSQTAIDGLVGDISLMVQQITTRIQMNVSEVLQRNGLDMRNITGLLEVFSDPFLIDPFKQLHSKYLQDQFYKTHFNLLVS